MNTQNPSVWFTDMKKTKMKTTKNGDNYEQRIYLQKQKKGPLTFWGTNVLFIFQRRDIVF